MDFSHFFSFSLLEVINTSSISGSIQLRFLQEEDLFLQTLKARNASASCCYDFPRAAVIAFVNRLLICLYKTFNSSCILLLCFIVNYNHKHCGLDLTVRSNFSFPTPLIHSAKHFNSIKFRKILLNMRSAGKFYFWSTFEIPFRPFVRYFSCFD